MKGTYKRGSKTKAAFCVAARLMRFVQNRAEFDSIKDSPRQALAFTEIIQWANDAMGKPSLVDMDRWEELLPGPSTCVHCMMGVPMSKNEKGIHLDRFWSQCTAERKASHA